MAGTEDGYGDEDTPIVKFIIGAISILGATKLLTIDWYGRYEQQQDPETKVKSKNAAGKGQKLRLFCLIAELMAFW